MLVYGTIQRYVVPPYAVHYMRISVAERVKSDLGALEEQGGSVLRCKQRAGQAQCMPRRRAHAVLNMQNSAGVSWELSLADAP